MTPLLADALLHELRHPSGHWPPGAVLDLALAQEHPEHPEAWVRALWAALTQLAAAEGARAVATRTTRVLERAVTLAPGHPTTTAWLVHGLRSADVAQATLANRRALAAQVLEQAPEAVWPALHAILQTPELADHAPVADLLAHVHPAVLAASEPLRAHVRQVALASARDFPPWYRHWTLGVMARLPLSAAEGLELLERYYGTGPHAEDPEDARLCGAVRHVLAAQHGTADALLPALVACLERPAPGADPRADDAGAPARMSAADTLLLDLAVHARTEAAWRATERGVAAFALPLWRGPSTGTEWRTQLLAHPAWARTPRMAEMATAVFRAMAREVTRGRDREAAWAYLLAHVQGTNAARLGELLELLVWEDARNHSADYRQWARVVRTDPQRLVAAIATRGRQLADAGAAPVVDGVRGPSHPPERGPLGVPRADWARLLAHRDRGVRTVVLEVLGSQHPGRPTDGSAADPQADPANAPRAEAAVNARRRATPAVGR